MSQSSEYRYSITIKTDDEAILHCLRALSMYTQATGIKTTPCRGTGGQDWKHNNNCVVFHFSAPEYRKRFMIEALRLLPKGSWENMDERDNDPPT